MNVLNIIRNCLYMPKLKINKKIDIQLDFFFTGILNLIM